jgi:hypothetical protein
VTSVGSLRLLLDRRCVELWELEVKVERDKFGERQGKALSKDRLGLGAREVRYVEGCAAEATSAKSSPLRCAICHTDIPDGTGHFRLAESRVHLECLLRRGTVPPGVA